MELYEEYCEQAGITYTPVIIPADRLPQYVEWLELKVRIYREGMGHY